MKTHWHRLRREIVEFSARQETEDSVLTAILMLLAGALLTVTTGLWVMLQLEQFGPAVGSVIVFRPSEAATERWFVNAALVAPVQAGWQREMEARRCNLNPGVMATTGGSLVIETRRLTRPPVYRVHWAGGRTDAGASDCGSSADVILSRTELMRLANVAGGFSGGIRLIGP